MVAGSAAMSETETKTKWRRRVASWRESGETTEKFSSGRGFSAGTLRWWSSRLGRDVDPNPPPVRLARLVRSPAAEPRDRSGGIVIELLDARARIRVEAGVDRDSLATVVEVLGMRGAR
jgi:hypothetical protein